MDQVVLGPGDGEVVSHDPGSRVVIKAGLDALAVTESVYAPGESGPDAHVHHEHVDAFYVLDGRLVFEVGPARERRVAHPGTFVLVPPEVVHTFRNEGPGDARFLNVHAPSKDFHRQLRGEDVDFDTDDPPDDGGRPADEVVVGADGRGSDPAGRLACEVVDVPALLDRDDDAYRAVYVLEGTARLGSADAPASTFALLPPGTPAELSALDGTPGRALNLRIRRSPHRM